MDPNFIQEVKEYYDNKALDLKLFSEICTLKKYKANTFLSKVGQFNNKASFIKKGIVKYYQVGKNEEEIIFTFRYNPAFIAYSASGFFLNHPSQMFCQAITEIEVYELKSEKLFELADNNTEIYIGLVRLITNIYVDIETKEYSVLEKTSTERYKDFARNHPYLLENVPMRSIASYLNIQPGSLSRIRKNISAK